MRADLKDERDVFLTESGRLFHNIGAEEEKARSPYVTEFTVGTVKRSLVDLVDLDSGECQYKIPPSPRPRKKNLAGDLTPQKHSCSGSGSEKN